MEIRVYYDTGDGRGALVMAALAQSILPNDRLPAEAELQQLFDNHYRKFQLGRVYRLDGSDRSVLWCGLGRSTPYTIRAWRHFLHLYGLPQSEFIFIEAPCLQSQSLTRHSLQKSAKEVRKKFAGFQTVLLQRWKEDRR